ncbi:hypothetical protein ES705_45994 [subsurface metagenome]
MSKKLYSKVWSGTINVEAGQYFTGPEITNALHSWLVQDDIEVVGANLSIISTTPSENDGFAQIMVELSQTGIYGQDGAIACAMAQEGWNTTPAGISAANANVAVIFPDGKAMPVKEEGHLYLNTCYTGKTASFSTFNFEVIIFYTKTGRR